MKTILTLAVLLLAAPVFAATNPFGQFQSRARPELIKPFALDLGGLLGSDSAHTGRTIGFPGFWAGVVGAIQTRPDSNDLIMRNAGVHAFGLPMVEVGVGLPFKFDVIVHGVSYDRAKIYGGGVRYGLYRTDVVDFFLPNVSVSAFGDKVNDPDFAATHLGLNAAATWSLPLIKPFLIAGFDSTKVTVGAAAMPGLAGTSATAKGSRFSLGADLTPFPFASLRAAYTMRHGIPGFDLGIGVRF
jgi:hypothetical protein